MEGGKSRNTLTVADLGPKLSRVLTENAFDYTVYLMLALLFLFAVMFIDGKHYELVEIIITVLVYIGLLALLLCGMTLNLNLRLKDHVMDRDTFLKYRGMWRLLAPLLLLQPRAYPLMTQYLHIVQIDDAEGKEDADWCCKSSNSYKYC